MKKPGFDEWYAAHAKRRGLDPNPDNPLHFYDYRQAYREGAEPDHSGHWPSKYKTEHHPSLLLGDIDTRSGKRIKSRKSKKSDIKRAPRRICPYHNVPLKLDDDGVWRCSFPGCTVGIRD